MPLIRKDYPGFTYLKYDKQYGNEWDKLKKEVHGCLRQDSLRDIVIDFGKSDKINSVEIGLLAKVLNNINGSQRYLRVITTPLVEETVKLTKVGSLPHIFFYRTVQDFAEALKKSN